MDDVARIKEAIDPIAFISTYTPLKRRGNRYWGLSPFVNEKTPSFTVRADGLFYCFSTSVGGDIIRFIELQEGLNFSDALARAAEFAGITLSTQESDPISRQQEAETKAAGFTLLHTAQGYFQKLLIKSSKAEMARQVLIQREFSQDIWELFGLGYAWGLEEDWTQLVQKKGWSIDLSRQVGLTHANQNHDRFRHRLMFPILDTRANCAGFGGRRLNEEERAKYINSSDSAWFHKGQLLFGYTLAQPSWQEKRRAIICEGYTDVMRFHAAGYTEAVAPLGTALTTQQASRLGAHNQTVTLAFDSDAAGTKAALNAWALLAQRGVQVLILDLPAGADPDSFIREQGAAEVKQKLDDSSEFWSQFLDKYVKQEKDTTTKRKLIDQVIDKLAQFQDQILAELLADELAAAAGVSGQAVTDTIQKLHRNERKTAPTPARRPASISVIEEQLAAWIFAHPEKRFDLQQAIADHAIHDWLRAAIEGKDLSEPGYRDWLGRVANQKQTIVINYENLLAAVKEHAEERARKQQVDQLIQQERKLRADGETDAARQILSKINAFMQPEQKEDR